MSLSDQHRLDPARSIQDIQSRYDAISPWYDFLTGFGEGRVRKTGIRLQRAVQGETILEIGCGTGQTLVSLARSIGEGGWVYGIDLSSGMIARAQSRLARQDLSKRVSLLIGDGRILPFSLNRFDAIWTSFTLDLLSPHEINQVLGECRRVLIPGGTLGVIALARRAKSNATSAFYDWLHEKFPQWIDCHPIFLQQLLLQAGFCLENVESMSLWGLPVEIVLAKNGETAVSSRSK